MGRHENGSRNRRCAARPLGITAAQWLRKVGRGVTEWLADLATTAYASDLAVYGGLFAIAFVAATVLPAQSEAVLVALLLAGDRAPVLLVLVATAGNVLGSVVNWLLGLAITRFRHRPWFPASDAALIRAERWYGRYGRWSLLASWVPIIGDPLTVMAGVLREPFWSFVLLVTVAKLGRYIILAAITLGLFG